MRSFLPVGRVLAAAFGHRETDTPRRLSAVWLQSWPGTPSLSASIGITSDKNTAKTARGGGWAFLLFISVALDIHKHLYRIRNSISCRRCLPKQWRPMWITAFGRLWWWIRLKGRNRSEEIMYYTNGMWCKSAPMRCAATLRHCNIVCTSCNRVFLCATVAIQLVQVLRMATSR